MENENQEKEQKPFYKKAWFIAAAVIFGLIVIGNMGSKESEPIELSTPPEPTGPTEVAPTTSSEPESNWTYQEDEDKMTNEKWYFATNTSLNEVEFEFPYNGGSSLRLVIRQMGKGNEVLFQITNGQFMTSIMSDESIRVKFNDEPPITFTYNSAADGSSEYIFLNSPTNFLSKLKTAEKLKIECTFFQEGRKQFDFNTAGLKWNK